MRANVTVSDPTGLGVGVGVAYKWIGMRVGVAVGPGVRVGVGDGYTVGSGARVATGTAVGGTAVGTGVAVVVGTGVRGRVGVGVAVGALPATRATTGIAVAVGAGVGVSKSNGARLFLREVEDLVVDSCVPLGLTVAVGVGVRVGVAASFGEGSRLEVCTGILGRGFVRSSRLLLFVSVSVPMSTVWCWWQVRAHDSVVGVGVGVVRAAVVVIRGAVRHVYWVPKSQAVFKANFQLTRHAGHSVCDHEHIDAASHFNMVPEIVEWCFNFNDRGDRYTSDSPYDDVVVRGADIKHLGARGPVLRVFNADFGVFLVSEDVIGSERHHEQHGAEDSGQRHGSAQVWPEAYRRAAAAGVWSCRVMVG